MASILVIDDSELVQNVVTLTLATQGHQVTAARSMRHGVRKIRDSAFDLILMDLNMPEVRGEAGIKLLRERLALTTPIIILSGEITTATILETKPLGVAGYVAKSEHFEDKLSWEVARVLGGSIETD